MPVQRTFGQKFDYMKVKDDGSTKHAPHAEIMDNNTDEKRVLISKNKNPEKGHRKNGPLKKKSPETRAWRSSNPFFFNYNSTNLNPDYTNNRQQPINKRIERKLILNQFK